MFQNGQIVLWLKLQEKNPELSTAIKVSKNWAHYEILSTLRIQMEFEKKEIHNAVNKKCSTS